MTEARTFTDAIRATADRLRDEAHAHLQLNRAAARIDHLGRQLHGLGFVREREIAACLTTSMGELSASHALPEAKRADAVRRIVLELEAALGHAAAGVLPAAS